MFTHKFTRWPADRNIQFIKEYQQYECLWDLNHPQYKNREVREVAYKKIMAAMDMESVKDVISKIRTLRNTYNNEVLKAKKDRYISKIPWVPYFDFLKNTDNTCNMSSVTREDKASNVKQDPVTESKESRAATASLSHRYRHARNKKKLIKDPLLKAVDVIEKFTTRLSSNENDEFYFFGQTVAEQLRQLPMDVALETEQMILSTIRKQRIRIANSEQTAQSVPVVCIPIKLEPDDEECIEDNKYNIPEEQ